VIDLLEVANAIARSEIDFRTLYRNLRASLEMHSQRSIADVLEQFPATQGLGTIVGYLSIGIKLGVVVPDAREPVAWTLEDSSTRAADIPLVYFFAERLDELHE
jgi:Protein of unknown function (DUF3375)